MKIIRASHLGMCFGVRDAINLAAARALSNPTTVVGQLVHNQSVIAHLQSKGVQFADRIEDVATRDAIVTAHGASNRAKERMRQAGLNVIEATCPLVHVAHRAVAALAADGCFPVIIGKPGHVEVRGLTEDLDEFAIVQCEEDIRSLNPRPRFGVAAQTTQPIARVRTLVDCLRRHFPGSEVRFIDTVCQPTKQRQSAAEDLAKSSSVVVVIGGSNSNNTRELVATCSRFCPRVHHVQTAADLRAEWFESRDVVGITAGTSTPDDIIRGVELQLKLLADQLHTVSSKRCAPAYA